jgi:hypothetical protein
MIILSKKIDSNNIAQIGSVIHGEFFEGTYLDNITFNDKDNTQDLKWALDGVQLGFSSSLYHKA